MLARTRCRLNINFMPEKDFLKLTNMVQNGDNNLSSFKEKFVLIVCWHCVCQTISKVIVQSCENMMITFSSFSTELSKCTFHSALSIVQSDKAFPVEHDVLLASSISSNKIGMVLLIQEKWRLETCCETVVFCNGRILYKYLWSRKS